MNETKFLKEIHAVEVMAQRRLKKWEAKMLQALWADIAAK
jgi:ferredoxin-fold anticodon binding domain-containing protein